MCYVGEARRTLIERCKEHKKSICNMDVERSEIARHAHENDYRINLSGMKLIEKDCLRWRRRISWEQKTFQLQQSRTQHWRYVGLVFLRIYCIFRVILYLFRVYVISLICVLYFAFVYTYILQIVSFNFLCTLLLQSVSLSRSFPS